MQFYPNGSDYLGVEDGATVGTMFKGQITPDNYNPAGENEGGKLILDPKDPEPYFPRYTYNLVPKNFDVEPLHPGVPHYRAQDFPTLETVQTIQNAIVARFPGLTPGVQGDPVTPTKFEDSVKMTLTNDLGSCSVDPGQLAFTEQTQGRAQMLMNAEFALRDAGMLG